MLAQDQNVQKLMNDLDLPSDRANLFEALGHLLSEMP